MLNDLTFLIFAVSEAMVGGIESTDAFAVVTLSTTIYSTNKLFNNFKFYVNWSKLHQYQRETKAQFSPSLDIGKNWYN